MQGMATSISARDRLVGYRCYLQERNKTAKWLPINSVGTLLAENSALYEQPTVGHVTIVKSEARVNIIFWGTKCELATLNRMLVLCCDTLCAET